jgi:hypothetical protein
MTQFINLTPHAITIDSNGIDAITVQPSGMIARVSTSELDAGDVAGIPVIRRAMGEVSLGIVRDQIDTDTVLLVSSMVLDAIPEGHELLPFCFAPDTGATAKRNDKGHIISVSRLVGK